MIRYFFVIGILALMGCSPSSAKRIPKKEILKIDESYQRINFTPETITSQINSDFDLTITPIDAKLMNQVIYETASYDGNYEKIQSVSTLMEEQLRKKTLSKEERRNVEFRKQIVEYLREKISQRELPRSVGEYLTWKIWNKSEGTDGTKISIGNGYPSLNNPYKVNRKYLSVFRLTFKNMSTSIKRIDLDNLLFNSGYEQLYPFKTSYFEKLYEDDQEKIRTIYRLNIPNELVVPPGEVIVKYVSIPSLNPTTEGLNIKYISEGETKKFEFDVSIEEQLQTTLLEKITFKAEDEWKLQVKRYYWVIVTPDDQIHIIKNNSLFLPQEIKDKNLSIYGIATLITGYTFAKKENFTLSQYLHNEVELDFNEKQQYEK